MYTFFLGKGFLIQKDPALCLGMQQFLYAIHQFVRQSQHRGAAEAYDSEDGGCWGRFG